MTIDLTTGSPMRRILSFGIPVLIGNLIQQLYNVVDTAIVGKTLGYNALAAVGSTGAINFLVLGFCIGICGGFAIPVAQQFGAGNHRELRRDMTGGVLLCLLFSVAITAGTLAGCRWILNVMNTPDDIFGRAQVYICTIFAGIPVCFLYNFCAGILRSLGDSRTPVLWLVASSLLNIGLDLLFIVSFHMDVFGAALATVLSQAVAGVGCLVRLCRGFPILRTERADWAWDGRRLARLSLMGLPMGLQYSITGIGSMMVQAAVNDLGTGFVAAVTAGNKISLFLACPFDAMGSTMATFGGQNVGAKKLDRLPKGLKACALLGLCWAVMALGVIFFFGDGLSMLFLDQNGTELLPLCRQYLRTYSAFYFPLSLVNIVRFLIQGMGFVPLATLAGGFELAARGMMSMLVPTMGFAAVCAASPVAWLMADVFLIPAFFFCLRHLRGNTRSQNRKRMASSFS